VSSKVVRKQQNFSILYTNGAPLKNPVKMVVVIHAFLCGVFHVFKTMWFQ
jgi:hypothetical protein